MPISPHHIARPATGLGTAQQIADLGRRIRTLEGIYGVINSVQGAVIAPGSVGTGQLAPGSVTSPIIAGNAVNPIHVNINTIQPQHISDNAVVTRHITAGNINHTHIGSNEILTNHIAANTIVANHISANAIQANHIAANQIQAGHITANAIQSNHIAANQVIATHIAANQIQAGHLSANSVTANAIAAGAVTAGAIAANAVTAGTIAAGVVTAGTIAAFAVTAGTIAAGAITTSTIAASAITTTTIAASAITSDKIATGAVTANAIAAGAVTSYAVATGILSAMIISGESMTLSNSATSSNKVLLDATGIKAFDTTGATTLTISSADGSITASKGTITGATLQTSANANTSKVVLDSNGIRAYDSIGNNTFNVDTTGLVQIAKSTLTLSGTIPAGTNARITLDATGIKAYNATNANTFLLDATTGLIQCTGVITAQPGSSLPAGSITGALTGSANRYSNSSFQNGAAVYDFSNWVVSGGTAASGGTDVPPIYGGLTLKLTASATGTILYIDATPVTDPYRRVLPGLNYVFSHYEYAFTRTETARIDVEWYDSAGTLLSTTTGATQTATVGQYTRITQVAAAPTNAAYARGLHRIAISPTAADVIYVDGMQMEMGDVVSAWAPRPDEILYQQINANHINVSSLAAISANLGTIIAGSLTSVSIASATITAGTINIGSGAFQVSSSGALTATSATISGTITSSSTISGATIWMSEGSVSSPATSQRIYWSQDSGATMMGNIFSAEYVLSSNTIDIITVESRQHSGQTLNQVYASLKAANSSGAEFASLQAYGTSASSSACYAVTNNGANKYTVLDGSNNSDFARWRYFGIARWIDWGVIPITFSSSSIASTSVPIGAAPAKVIVSPKDNYANITVQATETSTGFTLTAVSAPGTTLNTTYNVSYIAII